MATRFFKKDPKSTCSVCDGPLEPERIGKQSHCKKCRAQYMKDWRRRRQEEFYRLKGLVYGG